MDEAASRLHLFHLTLDRLFKARYDAHALALESRPSEATVYCGSFQMLLLLLELSEKKLTIL